MRNPSPTSPPPRCPLPPALLLALAAAFLLALVSAALLHFRRPAPPSPPPPPPPPAESLPPLSFSSTSAPLSAFPDLATHARESPRGLPWLLAFSRPLVPADRAAVAAAGARILGFIPPRALLLEAPPDSRSALAALPGVADSSPLPPYRKIAPDLASAALSSPSAPVTVAVATTSPDDAPALAAALASAVSARLSSNSRRVLAAAPIRSDSWGTPSRAARNADS